MGKETGISWCDHSFNPWIGCTKVSEGCKHCYAERDNNRYKWTDKWGNDGTRKRTSEATWKNPLKWDKQAKADGVRRKVFCASLADVFEDRDELWPWRIDLFNLIGATQNLDWLLLTKRPENIIHQTVWSAPECSLPDNVWIGTTSENQEMAYNRIPELVKIPAKIRFLSVEPMLGRINLSFYFKYGINWVICGGESGPGARPMNLDWARDLRDQCESAYVPFFFKQVGGTTRIDGKWGGDLLDGKRYHEFPK